MKPNGQDTIMKALVEIERDRVGRPQKALLAITHDEMVTTVRGTGELLQKSSIREVCACVYRLVGF